MKQCGNYSKGDDEMADEKKEITHFTFRGQKYLFVKPKLGELTYFERELSMSANKWPYYTAASVSWLVSIRRHQLANGVTPLMTWSDMMDVEPEEIEEAEADPVPAPEEAPVDPTPGGGQMETPAVENN